MSGIALLAAAQAIAAPTPIVERDAPLPVTTVTSEQLERLPANRDFRAVLNVHNQLRSEVGARPLRWNPTLAEQAQQYADVLAETGTVQHSSRIGRENQRENIVVGRPSGISPVGMVQIWVDERRFFRPGTFPNVCIGGWSQCGHYTQMIWPATTDIGCGYARGRFDAFVCRYSPPGNKDGVAIGPGLTGTIARQPGGLCTGPGGSTILCQNDPEGGLVDDGGGGAEDDAGDEEVACVVDVKVHRPISVAPEEAEVPEGAELDPGATTLRNDDADWRLGREAGAGELPVMRLPTDIDRAANANENDLVKVEGLNPNGLPGVYIFAFPTHAEADRNLATRVEPVNGGRHANAQELGYFSAASKAAPAAGLPLIVPRATSFWVEAMLGGRYRMVIGKLVAGVAPAEVRYDRDTGAAYVMREKNRVPAFVCEDQATVTAAVVDIFQENRSTRHTAFDVYWAGRPHFRADVWPGKQAFNWGEPYRLGANVHTMPGTAVNNEKVATMVRDREDVSGDANASLDRPKVFKEGKAGGDFAAKGRIEGGFQINAPQEGNVPTINRNPADRYPNRVSLQYEVNGEKLVRPEYLEVILPAVRPPAAPAGPVAGTATGVASQVQYTIVDAFDRVIKAENIADYLHLYGAGMKAWEALEGQPGRVIESGPRNRPDRFNDYLFITNTGVDGRGQRRDPIGPLGTAQRSQTTVREDRMTRGTFQDTLVFNASNDVNAREALWKAATGREGATPQETRQRVDLARDEARQRNRSLQQGQDVAVADQGRITGSPVMAIPQDVILQLRIGARLRDLMVFQGNTLSVFAPYFFNDTNYPGDKNDPVFRYHIQFTAGAATSQLVDPPHRRP